MSWFGFWSCLGSDFVWIMDWLVIWSACWSSMASDLVWLMVWALESLAGLASGLI
jgi:hypothetical protein